MQSSRAGTFDRRCFLLHLDGGRRPEQRKAIESNTDHAAGLLQFVFMLVIFPMSHAVGFVAAQDVP
jgi:hypothetical protein